MTLAVNGFEVYRRATYKAKLLLRMGTLVPQVEFCSVIESCYPKVGDGRQPVGLERMLRRCFIANRFNLPDVACEDALL